jgi:hypothetical protein
VSEDLDVNLTVPVLFSEFREKVLQEGMAPFANGAAQVGVGDIFLRGKNRIVSRDWLQAALGLVLRLPAGNEDNFQGTGDFEVAPMLYATTRRFHPGGSIHLLPYLNAGVDFDAQSVGSSEARWGLGLDCGLGEAAVVAIAVLARHAFQRLLPPGFTSFRHTDGSIRPLFGIEGGRPDIYDFSIGGRVNLWRDTVMVFANAVVPLNEDGIRATVIPTAGVEATF